jgi:hypothetical protein
VDQNVPESHDLRQIGNLCRKRRVEARELSKRVAKDLELAFSRRA